MNDSLAYGETSLNTTVEIELSKRSAQIPYLKNNGKAYLARQLD
jgi:hypothetical protein